MRAISSRYGALLLTAGLLLATACRKSTAEQQASSAASGASGAPVDGNLPPGHVPIPSAVPTGLEPVTQALLDSGNAAFRLKNFEGALAYYAKARDAQPDHAAPWFGTYMVAQATNNTALADSALKMVRARAPELQEGSMPTPGAVPGAAGGASPHYSPHQAAPTSKGSATTPARS